MRLSVVPFRHPPPPEVAVVALRVPDKVDVGQTFEVAADVYSSRPTSVRARLYQGETLNGLDGVREVALKSGLNELTFKSVVRVGGELTYELALEPLGPDEFSANNRYSATLDVPGRPSVLYVEGQPARASYLSSALGAQQFDVDVRAPSAFPSSLRELERYDFVIVSDTPREAFPAAGQELVEKYVRDLGGGFLFAGGDAGFGLGGWGHTTFERLLPVRMDAERRKEMPDVAMALVIDRSGSMTGLPMEMAKAACTATLGALQPDDLLEVISAFDSTPTRYVKLGPARYRSRIQSDIERVQPGGGTEIFPAIDMAYQDLSVVRARRKHVILLTDGQAAEQGIRELVQAMVSASITVTTVGLGEGVKQDLLRGIADAGGGRFHFVPDPNSLPKIFTRETEMVSQQAGVEEWFPVEQVAPADFLKGIAIGSAPLLHGYVATELKPAPAQLVLVQSDRAASPFSRRAGAPGSAGRSPFTSDVKNHWGASSGCAGRGLPRNSGAARARAHARETPPRARDENDRDRLARPRHGRCLHDRRTVRRRPRVEALRQPRRQAVRAQRAPVPSGGARTLRSGLRARRLRLVPLACRALAPRRPTAMPSRSRRARATSRTPTRCANTRASSLILPNAHPRCPRRRGHGRSSTGTAVRPRRREGELPEGSMGSVRARRPGRIPTGSFAPAREAVRSQSGERPAATVSVSAPALRSLDLCIERGVPSRPMAGRKRLDSRSVGFFVGLAALAVSACATSAPHEKTPADETKAERADEQPRGRP